MVEFGLGPRVLGFWVLGLTVLGTGTGRVRFRLLGGFDNLVHTLNMYSPNVYCWGLKAHLRIFSTF